MHGFPTTPLEQRLPLALLEVSCTLSWHPSWAAMTAERRPFAELPPAEQEAVRQAQRKRKAAKDAGKAQARARRDFRRLSKGPKHPKMLFRNANISLKRSLKV